MTIVEFQTYNEHGMIELPEEYHGRVTGPARVIILVADVAEDEDMIDFLLVHPYQVDTFTPPTRDEIYERR